MSLSDYQISFGGLLVGDETDYDLKKEEGLTSWQVRTDDDDFPLQWGSIPGTDEVNARVVKLSFEMLNDPTTIRAFRDAYLPSESTLSDLKAKFPEFEEEITVQARVRNRPRVRTIDDVNGVVKFEPVELYIPDPRLYFTATESEAVPVFFVGGDALDLTAGSGADLGFDLTAGSGTDLGFDFTGVTSSGEVIVTNRGNVNTYPVLLFTPDGGGPMTQWVLTNETTGETATFATDLNPGQTMTVDMAMVATSKTGSPVTINGSSLYQAWQQPRTPLRIVPGPNTLRFDVLSGTAGNASCLVTASSAVL